MEWSALFLSRVQFAFTVSFHIVFPSFTIGLAAWLTLLEGLHLWTKRPVYRRLFEFWLAIFAVAFGLGVVSGIVMGFQFGTNWSRLSESTGPVQGPLLAYESFTAFALEASFFGVLVFGRKRVSPPVYFLSTAMVALGTTSSAFWIMINNSWMQAPVGYTVDHGMFVPTDWRAIIFNPVVWVRFPHMLIAAYVTGAFCVAATGAWYRLRGNYAIEARVMLGMGLGLATFLMPMQLLFGHLNGDYVHDRQPAKFAAIEARWHDEEPAAEVLIAWPDAPHEVNRFELKVPYLGSLIAASRLTSKEMGLTDFPVSERPPVGIPFFTFRLMVGCGLAMVALGWVGFYLHVVGRLERSRWCLWLVFVSFPLPFIATLTGWFTAEVGRQPWTVYGLLRTADAVTPELSPQSALTSLVFFGAIYLLIFSFGTVFIYRLLRAGPQEVRAEEPASPKRPLAVAAGASMALDSVAQEFAQ
jgi:cytochrome bd ubiquinol oxidase subunit I